MRKALTIWIVIYHHHHGEDVYPLLQKYPPTQDEMAKMFENDYEPDREDEYFEARGPFEL